ncbi:hypothetical protein [Rhodovibrio salinarum]|uniref:Holin-X, holin superfamily III n=1 Tax=Rhodovibrio salinarum TaxID=1087 RepID=A0A934QG74_9PROT|nr:hypothetical protein [Rhodovibrio salinarum]MBK1696189.1 hypothetical protein [Rhodovibrio salinarum]
MTSHGFADMLARVCTAIALLGLAGIVLVATLGGIAASIFLGLAELLHPAWAALGTAAAGLVFVAGCLLFARVVARSPARREPRRPESAPQDGVADNGDADAAEDDLARLQALAERVEPAARRNLGPLGLAAFALGVLLGRRPDLRRELIAALKERA